MEKFSLKAFSSATQEDSIKFGWKAVRQALLSKAGFRVPEGFLLCVKHRLTRAHREKQLKMSCQALHNAPPNRT